MKKIFFLIAVLSPMIFVLGFEKSLSSSELQKKFGNVEFVAEKFKNGEESIRASMSASIVKDKNKFKGKTLEEIRTLLGDPDGFYGRADIYPAYLIFRAKDRKEPSWQLLFVLDSDLKAKDIKVVEN